MCYEALREETFLRFGGNVVNSAIEVDYNPSRACEAVLTIEGTPHDCEACTIPSTGLFGESVQVTCEGCVITFNKE